MTLTSDAVAGMFAQGVQRGSIATPRRAQPKDSVTVFIIEDCMDCGSEVYCPVAHDNLDAHKRRPRLCSECADF